MEISEELRKKVLEIQSKSPLLVYYGFAKLTPKIVRKPSLVIIFDNCRIWNKTKERSIKQKIHLVCVREQLPEEVEDAKSQTRIWSRYEYFIFDKKFKGDFERVLEENFMDETNTVSLAAKNEIRDRLRKAYKEFYTASYFRKLKIKVPKSIQQSLIFN